MFTRTKNAYQIPFNDLRCGTISHDTIAWLLKIEEKIASLQLSKTNLETKLGESEIYGNKEKFLQTETDYKKTNEELKTLHQQYEVLFEKILELEG